MTYRPKHLAHKAEPLEQRGVANLYRPRHRRAVPSDDGETESQLPTGWVVSDVSDAETVSGPGPLERKALEGITGEIPWDKFTNSSAVSAEP